MNGLFNPDSWMDVIALLGVALIVGIPSTIGAIAGVRAHRVAKQANEQVSNSHRTNFRDDVDKKADKDDVAAVHADLGELKQDFAEFMTMYRTDRRETNRRLDAQERLADRWHPGEL